MAADGVIGKSVVDAGGRVYVEPVPFSPVQTSAPIPAAEAVAQIQSAGLGYERVQLLPGSTYRDSSTVLLIPTRGMMHHRFVSSLQSLIAPMNQKRAMFFVAGDEVGHAYNRMIQHVLDNPDLSKWKYVMTVEDDNLLPPDAQVRLLEAIEHGNYDAVSGIYFTKGDLNMPMAYGDPMKFRQTGVLDFQPLDIRAALAKGNLVEVNGIAMGCSLYRMELFRQIPAPWFVTVADVIEGQGVRAFTQDLYFAERACRAGKRFAVDMRVRVGHLCVNTGIVY